jgi:hypothetical protein
MRLQILVVTLLALSSTRAAAAEGDSSPFEARSTAVYAVFGLGTPVGLLGAEVEQMLLPDWSISAGAGFGVTGPQGSVMTHLFTGGSWSKLSIGAGISGGQFHWRDITAFDCDDCSGKVGTVAWGNVEIGGALRLPGGFAFRYFSGYGHIIAGDLVCDPGPDNCARLHPNDGHNLIYAGVGIGGAF